MDLSHTAYEYGGLGMRSAVQLAPSAAAFLASAALSTTSFHSGSKALHSATWTMPVFCSPRITIERRDSPTSIEGLGYS